MLSKFYLSVLSLFLLITLNACSFESQAQKAVRGYIEAVAAEDINKALTFIDMPKELNATEAQVYQGKIKVMISSVSAMIKSKGGIKELKLDKENKIDGDLVVVSFELIFNDGSNDKDKVKLIKRDDGYKITF